MDEPEITAESLLKAAAAEDSARGSTDTDSSREPEVTDPEPGTVDKVPDKPKAEPAEKKDAPIDKGKADKAVVAEVKPEEKVKSKWAQNEERKNKTWQEINAEKEVIKAEKEALQKEKAETQRKAQEIDRARATSEPIKDDYGLTAKEYRDLAKEYLKKGEGANADAAEKLAQTLDQKQQRLLQERNVAELRTAWQKSHDELIAKPEYADLKTEGSELHKQTIDVLKKYPFLQYQPDGLRTAVEMVEHKTQLKAFDGTKAELAKLKEEHSKLQKKLSIAGGSPTSTPEEDTPFEKLSLKEQEKFLKRAVHSHDREQGLE